jgi:hypothetical protein
MAMSVGGTVSELTFQEPSLTTGTNRVLKTLVHSPFSHPTWLPAELSFTEYLVHFFCYCMEFKPSFWQNIELKVKCSKCGVDIPEIINYCRVLYITNKSAKMPKMKTEQSLTHISHICITTVATLSVCSYSLCS